ncbi:hypothetical protein HNV08_07700 [Winogradskyella eckloniae]|uniref:hypothetical protein n=1 Tax=Winogradskyella eckloniae TaxID=1089306 RepID=UPI0015648D9D|nr:hypothetical protein [Winogradskyella eckloniae]NRD19927.1 hypothetical protein [Winogradskyella eckloniae]
MDINALITHLIELIAALSGSYYWYHTRDYKVRPFVWYLWVTVFVETLGMYTYFRPYFENTYWAWINNSVFATNTWLYNTYEIIGFILVGMFILRNTNKPFSHKALKFITIFYVTLTVSYYLSIGDFFTMSFTYDLILSTFALFLMFLLYLRELIQSDKILDFYKSHVFYICLGITLWHICLTPLFIFDSYYRAANDNFITFRGIFLDTANLLLYSCYTFAFIYSLWHKRQSALKSLH